MVFYRSLIVRKSDYVSRTLLSILADFNNWYILGGVDSFSGFQIFQSLFQIVEEWSRRPNYSWYHCKLHIWLFFVVISFFSSLLRSKYLSIFSLFVFFDPPGSVIDVIACAEVQTLTPGSNSKPWGSNSYSNFDLLQKFPLTQLCLGWVCCIGLLCD